MMEMTNKVITQWTTCTTPQGHYDGYINVENSMPEGYGHILYSNQDHYKGQWSNGLRHGYGYFKFNSVSEYFGWWENGVMTGPGIQRSSNNSDVYVGWFFNNVRSNRGLYIKGDSLVVYDGQWLDNKKNGHGKVFKDGSLVFDGCFENNMCACAGTKRTRSGTIAVCFYISGTAFGDGIEWSSCMSSAHRLDGNETKQKISVEEAHRSSNELGLPIPSPDFINDNQNQNRRDTHSNIFEKIKELNADVVKTVNDLSTIRDTIAEVFNILSLGQLEQYCLLPHRDEAKDSASSENDDSFPPLLELKIDEKKRKDEQNDSLSSISSSISAMSCCSSSYSDSQSPSSLGGTEVMEEKDGPGTLWCSNGYAECHFFEDGKPKGEGVIWNADRTKAWKSVDGVRKHEITLGDAVAIALGLGLFVPDCS